MGDRPTTRRRSASSPQLAGPLELADTTHREWDIYMSRDEQWLRVRTAITDPDQVRQDLEWFRLGNSSVTFHVVERTTTLHEELVDESSLPRA